MKTLPPSRITSPMHAAMITSLVRGLLSEALSRVPAGDIVFTATTDGFLTTLELSDIDCSGPVAAAFSEARLRLTGDREIWEQKHEVDGVVVVKTRCTYSRPPVDPATAGRPVLARGGYRPEQTFSRPWEECEFWIDLHRSRDFESEMTRRHLIPLRTQWIEDADLISLTRTTRVNLDFDWKRRAIFPTDIDGVMSGDTEPWETIDQFDAERDALESCKKSEHRVEKTVADLEDRRQWMRQRAGQQASGSTRQSGRSPLVNAVMRAIARRELSAPGWAFHRWASLFTQQGFAVSAQTFKDAARRGKLKMGALTDLTDAELWFAEGLLQRCPAIEIAQLAQAGSRAWCLLTEMREKAPETAPRAEDLGDPAAGPAQHLPVAGCLPPYSKAPPCAGPPPEITKHADSVYESGASADAGFKDIRPAQSQLHGPNVFEPSSTIMPPAPEPAATRETLPAATLPPVCRATRTTKVLRWAGAHRLLKRMSRMISSLLHRVARIANVIASASDRP
jgi:hypothetical protein